MSEYMKEHNISQLRVCGSYVSPCRECGHDGGNIVIEVREDYPYASARYIECPSCGKRTVHGYDIDRISRAWTGGYIFDVDSDGYPVYKNGKRVDQMNWGR